jgi:hypothetical protein
MLSSVVKRRIGIGCPDTAMSYIWAEGEPNKGSTFKMVLPLT